MRKRKKAIKETACVVAETELLGNPFLNQDDLSPAIASQDLPNELNSLIATIEPFDLICDPFLNDDFATTLSDPFFDPIAKLLGDQAPDPIAMLHNDPLLDPDLLEATMKLMVDDELVQLDLNWWFAQIEDEKSILFATLEATQANLDLGIILSTMREFANCLPTFAETKQQKNANFP